MITDDQIRALRESCLTDYFRGGLLSNWTVINLCRIALVDRDESARIRLADLINARAKESK